MTGRLYVSMLANDSGVAVPDDQDTVSHAYVVAVPECYRKDLRGALASCFPDLVNTVVGNVFIVNTAMAAQAFHASVAGAVARQRIPVDVIVVEDLNWVEISDSLQLPAAVA